MAMHDLVRQFARDLPLPTPTVKETLELNESWSSCSTIVKLAGALRAVGLPVQAISMEEPPAEYPFFGLLGDRYALLYRKGGKQITAFTAEDEEIILEMNIVQDKPIVTIPPVGTTFRINDRISKRQLKKSDDHEIVVFYAATNADAELAKEQVIPDLAELIKKSRREKKELVFIDAVGLIPEEVIHQFGLHNEVAAFFRVLDAIKRDLAGLRDGRRIYEARSPLWKEVYDFLAKERIRAVAEEIPQSLMKTVHEFDKKELAQRALSHFIAGQVDEAAKIMANYLRQFHELNCIIRNKYFVKQIMRLLRGSNRPLILFVLREIGHYGAIESNFPQRCMSTKIIGHEKFSELIGVPSYVNFGVDVTEETRQIDALRYCLKTLIASRIAGGLSFNEVAARLGESEVNHLSRETIDEVITALHHPARVFLRSTPHNQQIQDQLLYILVERRLIPRSLLPDPAESVLPALEGDKHGKNNDQNR